MNYIVEGYQPARVFRFFEDICAIPHGSGNEKGVADYIEAFAKARGLEYLRDEVGNMFVRMPASAGYEQIPPLLLQGHMDMVCEKNADVEHDFLRDGLNLYIEDGFLRARGTTLGGDDGIAVAMMLAVLDGEVENHPEVECLFTVEEETGLLGAEKFDYSVLHARRMLNLDSENEDEVTCGCAGGVRTDVVFSGEKQTCTWESVRLSVRGLCGGHSGAEIDKGRANANKVMGRLLSLAGNASAFRLVELAGGSKDNAIPRECFATVACADADAFCREFLTRAEQMRGELCAQDAGFTVSAQPDGCVQEAFCSALTDGVTAVLCCASNGVLAMSQNIQGLVEFSRNLGVVRTDEKGITCVFSSRSAIDSQLDASIADLHTLAAVCGGSAHSYARYPGWSYRKDSALRDDYLRAYRELYGKEPSVTVIHAGLECGIISNRVPDMDMISIGPLMRAIHSPDEALHLGSCERLFRAVAKVIMAK